MLQFTVNKPVNKPTKPTKLTPCFSEPPEQSLPTPNVLTGELSNYAGFVTQWSLFSDNQRKCMEVAKSREHRTDDSGVHGAWPDLPPSAEEG